MRAPLFWFTHPDAPHLLARLLSPVGGIYAALTAKRLRRAPKIRSQVPVICIGNINAGGTGKTPTTIALIERLIARGRSPHVVSRGYGGNLDGPVRVDERAHNAGQTGDEPLLLAAFAPTWVAKNRAAGVAAAQNAGADVILLDDGFQNPDVAKDLSIVVVDAMRGFGNGRVMPSGPLREKVGTAMARADLVLSIGAPAAQDRLTSVWTFNLPHLVGWVTDWSDHWRMDHVLSTYHVWTDHICGRAYHVGGWAWQGAALRLDGCNTGNCKEQNLGNPTKFNTFIRFAKFSE